MTAIVGVLCRDGVVLGADSSTTFGLPDGGRSIEQPSHKIDVVEGHVIVASTGSVGLAQRFRAIVEEAWRSRSFKGNPIDAGKHLCRKMLEDLTFTGLRPGQHGALLAFPCAGNPCLCEFALADFQPELKQSDRIWYCAMGSAQPIMDPFLGFIRSVFWQSGQPTVQDGIFAVTWTLDHAIEVNPGGVNGPARVAVLERNSKGEFTARLLADEDLFEHRENIEEAKARLRGLREEQGATSGTVPDVRK